MRHLLIINPNTRRSLTAELLVQIQPHVRLPLLGVTAPFGEDYIASETSYVVAAHAVLDAWHQHVFEHGRPRAVLVACFGDPGVWALRESAGVPVMGLAEAAMREADALGPFGIVTGGHAWAAMLERLARGLQLGGPAHLRHVLTVEATGGQLAADPQAGASSLAQACQQVLADDAATLGERAGAHAIEPAHMDPRAAQPLASLILGGAALGGWLPRMLPLPGCTLIDSVAAGARWLGHHA
jgi:allantoin racemase